jgi:FAD synthetase
MKKVLVGGTFNILHPGHIFFLGKAREHGDHLTVVVANDKNVLERKGFLVFPSGDRAEMVRNLKQVDNVIEGDEKDVFKIVEVERPDVIALGYDQDYDVEGLKKFMKDKGLRCKIVRIKQKYKNYSTKSILEKFKEF